MNFVKDLEECLRDLAAASRSRHPGVKEASERAVMKLRTLQTGYAAQVRKAKGSNQHPTTAVFRSSDLLHPFLLAANYPNADYKLLEISFRAMRLLMEADAVVPSDGLHMVRVYQIQAQVVTAYYQKLYAKEIQQKQQQQKRRQQQQQQQQLQQQHQQQQLQSQHEGDPSGDEQSAKSDKTVHSSDETAATTSAATSNANANTNANTANANANTNTGYSSWFSWGSSSTSTTTAAMSNRSSDHSGGGASKTLKNAVSSSTGQTGNQHAFSPSHAEKLALEILSSLLQLMELLRNHPETLSNNVELWTSAVALACGWFFLPNRQHTVRQAAHSTVSQILSLLFVVVNNGHKLIQTTWDDLLVLTESSIKNNNNNNNSHHQNLQGAFRLCQSKRADHKSNASTPPSPEFALELMTQLWKEKCRGGGSQFAPSDPLILKTMGVTMNLLQQITSANNNYYYNVEKALRTTQWTLTLVKSHAATHPNECRELLERWLPPVLAATEACRHHHDFEDGYVYNHHDGSISSSSHPLSGGMDSSLDDTAATASSSRRRTSAAVATATVTVFPEAALWKAAFVLEALYSVLDENNPDSAAARSVLLQDRNLVQNVAEALSDFATIGTSCRAHIGQVVDFVYTTSLANSNYHHHPTKPTVFRRAEAALASGYMVDGASAGGTMQGLGSGSSTKHLLVLDKQQQQQRSSSNQKILGESMWLALRGVLRICECAKTAETLEERESLLRQIFAPSLSVLQHFLKRFCGCEELVRLSLNGYMLLADTCLPLTLEKETCAMERKVLLTSLSKLSLPAWGKHDATSLLQDHHVRTLLCLLRIVHRHFDSIAAEWEIVLWTLEELSVLDIASPLLSDEAYHASLAAAAAYERFPGFSTCFSDASLMLLTEALTEIATVTMSKRNVVDGTTIVNDNAPTPTTALDRTVAMDRAGAGSGGGGEHRPRSNSTTFYYEDSSTHETSISGKIMNMGVRALYGGGSSGDEDEHGSQAEEDHPGRIERTRKAYYQDYRENFVRRIAASNNSARMNSIGRLPFALMLLSDVAMSNAFRSKECGDTMASQFSRLAATSPVTRPFVMDMMTMLLLSRLSAGKSMALAFEGRGKLVFDNPMQSQLLAVEAATANSSEDDTPAVTQRSFSQAEALAPLCETLLNCENVDVTKSSLEVLTTILEGTGQNLHGEVWSNVIDAIASLSGNASYRVDRTSSAWSPCCLMAFRALKLIVDDFLDELPRSNGDGSDTKETAHVSLLDCCSSFVGSRHDINTSLTAIGLLWTIADNQSSGDSTATDRALSELALLSSDDRAEVRNAAVNTLFSCIVGRGSGFSPAYWQSCIQSTVFGVYDIVSAKAGARAVADEGEETEHAEGGSTNNKASSRYKVRSHHTRDSAGKMWVATQVLVLRGLIRLLRSFFTALLDTTDDSDWFPKAWERILGFAFDAASQGSGRENLDIRSVGVELLVVSCQLASKAGIKAAVTPARVSTTMEVVNGALRSVRDSQPSKAFVARTHSQITELGRKTLFLEAFASLEAYESEVLKQRKAQDDSDLQILNKFCGNLSLLHDCCRQDEFKVDNARRSLEALSGTIVTEDTQESKPNDLECRFVQIVESVLHASGGDPKARFLNQGQRGAIDLLRSIAGHGSSVAFEQLVRIAGSSFFVRKDSDGIDHSDHGEHDTSVKHSATLLNFEAAAAVSQEISNDNVCDELRAYVLYLVLNDLESDTTASRRRYYKHAVPIVQRGLQSTSILAARVDDEAACKAVEMVWTKVLECLSQMLTPIPLGKDTFKISRVTEILSILTFASANVPNKFAGRLCEILSLGATKAFEAAKQHAINAETHPESELGRKSKRHRDDLLKLFFFCFSGSCSLQPEDPTLRSTADAVFQGARTASEHSMKVLCVEASLFVCQAIQENEGTQALVVLLFSSLCQIVVSDSGQLKEAAGKILTSFNIGETMQAAQTRYDEAEKRATAAEGRVAQLEREVALLKNEKELKKQESGGRKSLWGLG